MTPTLKTGLRFLCASLGMLLTGMVFVHPINHFLLNRGRNDLGEIRMFAFCVLTFFGLAIGLVAFVFLISAGIEIAGRFLWPRNPPDESEM